MAGIYEEQDSGNELTWASGNKGFKWAMSEAATEDYPTTQIDNGKTGKCVKIGNTPHWRLR